MTTLRRFKLHEYVLLQTDHLGQPRWETGQITGLRWGAADQCEVTTQIGKAEWLDDTDARIQPHPMAGAQWTEEQIAGEIARMRE